MTEAVSADGAPLHASFRRLQTPGTGRLAVQLTSAPGFCYPLYYYAPTLTADGRYLIFHRAVDGTVQLHRVDLWTAEELQLTHATAEDTWWRPWCSDPGTGVLDHRSALDVSRNQAIFFDGDAVRAVDVASGATRDLFELPHDRKAIGQNCVTPDGRWFVYIHADRAAYDSLFDGDPDYEGYWRLRERCRDTRLMGFNLETGEQRTILIIASPLHHVLAYDERRLLFCHPTAEPGMLVTDLDGGGYSHLRMQDEQGGMICHFVGTARGAAYEVLWRRGGYLAGMCDPLTGRTYEFALPADFDYVHTGRDPAGDRWFFENHTPVKHEIRFLVRHDSRAGDEWLSVVDNWPTYGDPEAQKAHFHPQLVLGGRWMLMTGGDPVTSTNQIYLVDVSDLAATTGIPDVVSPSSQ